MTDKLSDAELLSALNRIRDGWEAEYHFHPSRKWRFDYAHPQLLTTCQEQANVYGVGNRHWVSINHAMPVFTQLAVIAVEIEGAIYANGRHGRGPGMSGDMEKYNKAELYGWTLLRYPSPPIPYISKVTKTETEASKKRREDWISKILKEVNEFFTGIVDGQRTLEQTTQRTWSMTETSTVIE